MYPLEQSRESLALRVQVTHKIVQGLRVDQTRDLDNGNDTVTWDLRTGGHKLNMPMLVDKRSDTPAFFHPIKVDHNLISDARDLVSFGPDGNMRVRDHRELYFRTLRAALEQHWIQSDDNKEDFLIASDIPMDLYCKNFSESIARTLGLDPEVQAKLAAGAAYFYISLFGIREFETKHHQRVARVTRIPIERLMEWYPGIHGFDSLHNLCQYLVEVIDNPRLQKLSPAQLFNMMGNGWVGAAPVEVSTAALEYPPLWIAMIIVAADDRALRNSRVGKLVNRLPRDKDPRDFIRTIVSYIV